MHYKIIVTSYKFAFCKFIIFFMLGHRNMVIIIIYVFI